MENTTNWNEQSFDSSQFDYVKIQRDSSSNGSRQNLWRVNDTYFTSPEERFQKTESPLYEVASSLTCGPLEGAGIPRGMLSFAERLLALFKANPLSPFVTLEDIAYSLLRHLDFSDMYYVLVNMPVELCTGYELTSTFRFKKSGSVLNPSKLEVFKVVEGYSFPQYRDAVSFLERPDVVAVLEGAYVQHASLGRAVTANDVRRRLQRIVGGDSPRSAADGTPLEGEWIEELVYDLQEGHYEGVGTFDTGDHQRNVDILENARDQDMDSWKIAVTGFLMWLRSPHAIRYLLDFHPIYQAVLEWNAETQQPQVIEGTKGFSFVYGWDVYTLRELDVEPGVAAGTCVMCKGSLHCTELVNSYGVLNPICDCGEAVQLFVESRDDVMYDHHESYRGKQIGRKHLCEQYRARYPGYPRIDYLCHHCFQAAHYKTSREAKCVRTECPNTACSHHVGQAMYIQTLTARRRQSLTHQSS